MYSTIFRTQAKYSMSKWKKIKNVEIIKKFPLSILRPTIEKVGGLHFSIPLHFSILIQTMFNKSLVAANLKTTNSE
jgi:hypothetical protein